MNKAGRTAVLGARSDGDRAPGCTVMDAMRLKRAERRTAEHAEVLSGDRPGPS